MVANRYLSQPSFAMYDEHCNLFLLSGPTDLRGSIVIMVCLFLLLYMLFPHPYLVAKGQLSLWGGGKLDFDIILSKHGHRCITWGLSISIQCVAELCMSMNTNLCITLHKTFALCHYNNWTNVVKVYSHCYSGPWNLSCFWLLYSF